VIVYAAFYIHATAVSVLSSVLHNLTTGRSTYKQHSGITATTTIKEFKQDMLEDTLAELTKTDAQRAKEQADEKARKKEMKERLAQMRQRNKR